MRIPKIELLMLFLIFFPFIALLAINIIVSPYLFWNPPPGDEIIAGFAIFSLIYMLYLTLLKLIPKRFSTYYTIGFALVFIDAICIITFECLRLEMIS